MTKNILSNKFKVLPVKFSENSVTTQYLFYKAHNVREKNEDKPSDRTLFVINIPPYCTEECLKRLFSECGSVEKVTFQKSGGYELSKTETSDFPNQKPIQGYKVGYVVFSDIEHCKAAMQLTGTTPLVLSTTECPLVVGIKKWCEEYNKSIPDIDAMKNLIDGYMKTFDDEQKEKIRKEKEMDGVPDEEGWITVTRHGKRPVTPRTEAQGKKVAMKEKNKRANKELHNFYSFQIRESKMDHIVQLRKKFEDDKQRIAMLKATRKFRPY